MPDSPAVADAILPRSTWAVGPADYGEPKVEENAARTTAAVFDVSGRTHLTLTGRDRVRFLHGFCTNDIKRLSAGEGCEAFVTNLKGRIIEHVFVAVTADAIHVSGTAGFEEPLYAHLDRYLITDDVQIARRTADLRDLFVSGPQSLAMLDSIVEGSGSLAPYAHREVQLAGVACTAQRLDLLGCPGSLLTIPPAGMDAVRSALASAGARPAGVAVCEALRIAAALPLYGVDLTDENLAQEAMRTERCISFKKGCYLGQEPIARLDALGHVNRQLAVMELEAGASVATGAVLSSADKKEAGKVTSTALIPSTGRVIAMGMVRTAFAKPGTELFAESPEGRIRGEIVPAVA